ncbi:MAG TPA: hypothetical protein VJY35_10305 [Candidatus Eisenbacteria bacterium]|nr:hypothetical protein [Candidatus Eisenbacteria bacterium]
MTPYDPKGARNGHGIAALALIAALTMAGCAPSLNKPPAPAAPPPSEASEDYETPATETVKAPICYDCFWQYQPEGFKAELTEWYETHPSHDPLIDADRLYLLARVKGDSQLLGESRRAFEAARDAEKNPDRRLLLEETVAFTAAECGGDVRRSFDRAAAAAQAAGQPFKAGVYRGLANGTFHPTIGKVEIRKRTEVPPGTSAFILGESAIRVEAGERVGVQMERTVRDWLSYQLAWDFSGRAPGHDELINWHEGSRVRDILAAVPAQVVPLPGILMVRDGDRWLAADEQGVFRFEVLIDKVEYPTTRVHGDVALMVDSHGISSLVEPAVRNQARLVVGCGDTPFKAQAAWWLSTLGIDVYFPCDRMVGDLIGYEGQGTLIGSAPVRAENGVAVIGDRPIRFSVKEPIVAQTTEVYNGNQYYSAAGYYFQQLSKLVPLNLTLVSVDGPDQAERVLNKARELKSRVVALRVRTDAEAASVRRWLSDNKQRRAVLFHTAPYPAGYALFAEFPKQTTFGDPHPHFLPEKPALNAQVDR